MIKILLFLIICVVVWVAIDLSLKMDYPFNFFGFISLGLFVLTSSLIFNQWK